MLKTAFLNLFIAYEADAAISEELWQEIAGNYSEKSRYYHNLGHLENMLIQLKAVSGEINDWETVMFSLFYHDFIYDPLKSDNEEKSAKSATERLRRLGISESRADKCSRQIMATKDHQPTLDSDTNFLIDADLAILGMDWLYDEYSKNVRKEYAIFPDFIYNRGRKKVLNHFLEMPRIFKTDYFYRLFENNAKKNLQRELSTLKV